MKKPKSLSANISSLLNSSPQGFDEDDEIDDTRAKIFTADSDDSDQGEIFERSKIRSQNADLLETVDEKYAGKVSNRKRFRDSDSDYEDLAADEGGSIDEENSNGEEESDEDQANGFNSDEQCDEGSENEKSDPDGSEVSDDENFKHFTDATSNNSSSKGQCVRTQLSIWESSLEIRIKSKKGLSASNKLPVGQKFKQILSNADEECKRKLSQTKKSVDGLLQKMITLQTRLLKNYPETRKIFSKKSENQEDNDDDDEEITSEESDPESDEEPDSKRVKVQDFEKDLQEKHEVYRTYRNKTIEKWYDKTRIKHTEVNSHTIVDQINHILMDKSKLLKKTQLKRSNYQIIGESEEEEYNVHIYDDEDFYHQQLRELVEFKSSDITDPLQLSRKWVELQNKRSKMKRKVDTRATKGRKLRFGVHTKLLNILPAQEYENAKTEDARKELARSLFQ